MLTTYLAKLWGITAAQAGAAISQMSLATSVKYTTVALLAQAKAWLMTPMGMAAAAIAGIVGIIAATNALTTSFAEQKEKVLELSNEISNLETEYESLANKSGLTESERRKLTILEAQIAAKKELLRLESKELLDKWSPTEDNWGNRAKKIFTSGAYNAQRIADEATYSPKGYTAVNSKVSDIENKMSQLDTSDAKKYLKEYSALEKELADAQELRANIVNKLTERQNLLNSAQENGNELIDDQLAELSELDSVLAEYSNALADVGDSVGSLNNKVLSLSDTFEKLSAAKGSISSLSDAYKQLSEDGEVSFDTIAKIQESFADIDGIDAYIDTLVNAKGNTAETAQVLTDMTYAALVAELGINGLANATESHVASMLKSTNVQNANEIATYAIGAAKVAAAASTAALTNNTSGLINALNAESSASGVTSSALANLAAQQIITSNTGLNFGQQIAALQGLASAAFGATSAIAGVFGGGGTAGGLDAQKAVQDAIRGGLSKEEAQKGVINSYWKAQMSKHKAQFDSANTAANSVKFAGGGGGGGGGGGKEVEEYIADIEKLYEAYKRLNDIQYEIERLEVKSEITEDLSEKVEYLNQIVLLYKEQQKTLAEMANLRRSDILANIEELQKKGFEIEYNSTTNDLLVKNLDNINNITGKNAEETNELRKKYEDLISATEALNDANRDAAKQWWDLERTLKAIGNQYDDIISSAKDAYKSTIDAILKVIDKEKEALELQREIFENQKSDLETTVDTVVSFIDKQIEALKKENDELDRQIEAQKKLEEIERAKNQRGHKIYREGEGFVWGADQSAVNQAQQGYDEYKRKKDLDDKVQALEDYKKLWQDVTDGYQRGIDEQITADVLGANWQTMILAQKTTNIQGYANKYNAVNDQLNDKTTGSVAHQIKKLEELSEQWGNAYDEIEDALSDHKVNLDVLKNFEKGNYDERLTLLKGYVSSAIDEINKLKAAQAAAEAAAKTAASGGGTPGGLASHDFSTDKTDYSEKMANSKDSAEFQHWSSMRTQKMEAQGINPSNNGWKTNSEIYSEWKGFSKGGVADFTGAAMLHGGNAAEMILNNTDVGKIYDYIHNSPSIVQDMINEVAMGRLTPVNSKISPNASQNMSISINGMQLHGVQNVNELADAIDKQLPGILQQKLFRNK